MHPYVADYKATFAAIVDRVAGKFLEPDADPPRGALEFALVDGGGEHECHA